MVVKKVSDPWSDSPLYGFHFSYALESRAV